MFKGSPLALHKFSSALSQYLVGMIPLRMQLWSAPLSMRAITFFREIIDYYFDHRIPFLNCHLRNCLKKLFLRNFTLRDAFYILKIVWNIGETWIPGWKVLYGVLDQ